jgi:thiol-disulfide isomerase/thioredoxin
MPTINAAPKLYILHDNASWLEPIVGQLNALGVPHALLDLGAGTIDLLSTPPAGIFFNRVSPSSHSRGKRYAMEYGGAVVEWLERHGRVVLNGSGALRLENSKVAQELEMQRHGIASPPTSVVTGGADAHAAAIARFCGEMGGVAAAAAAQVQPQPQQQQQRFLLKHNRGGSGLGVRLFAAPEQALRYVRDDAQFEHSPDGLTLLQRAVTSPADVMYRVEFVAGRYMYAVRIDTSSVKVDEQINNCPADGCQLKVKEQQQAAAASASSPTPPAADAAAALATATVSTPAEHAAAAEAAATAGLALVTKVGASWCGACKRQAPAVEALRLAARGAVRFVGVDADDADDDLIEQLGVASLPTYLLQRPGEARPAALTLDELTSQLEALGGGGGGGAKRARDGDSEVGGSDGAPKRAKAAAAAAASSSSMSNCPLTSGEKFVLMPPAAFEAQHGPLLRRFEALMAANNVSVAGAELIVDAAGKAWCIDFNTNTNYSVAAETRFGERFKGAKVLAAFLQRQLAEHAAPPAFAAAAATATAATAATAAAGRPSTPPRVAAFDSASDSGDEGVTAAAPSSAELLAAVVRLQSSLKQFYDARPAAADGVAAKVAGRGAPSPSPELLSAAARTAETVRAFYAEATTAQ